MTSPIVLVFNTALMLISLGFIMAAAFVIYPATSELRRATEELKAARNDMEMLQLARQGAIRQESQLLLKQQLINHEVDELLAKFNKAKSQGSP